MFALLVLELIFGSWFNEDKWLETRSINIIRDAQINYDAENIYGKDSPSVIYTRDKNGLRGSCKNPKEIDILSIGGSTTDQRYVPDGQTYQDFLQSLLSQQYGKQICVSNAGIDGHSSFGHLESFKVWFPLIEGLKPKYFLFYVGINDAGFRTQPIAGVDLSKEYNESTIRNKLRKKSAIYNLPRNLHKIAEGINGTRAYAMHSKRIPSDSDYIATKKSNSTEVQIAKNAEAFKNRFWNLILQTRSYNAKPICVSQPHLFTKNIKGTKKGVEKVFEYEGVSYNGLDYDASISELNKIMMRLCLEGDGYFIDIASKKFEVGDFYDSIHMTKSGTKRLGTYMYDEFVSQKIKI